MNFCGMCTTDKEHETEIEIRDSFNMNTTSGLKVANPQLVIQAMQNIPNFNFIVPSKFHEYLENCKRTGKKFTDSEFPPQEKSLKYQAENRKIEWKRISDIFPKATMV